MHPENLHVGQWIAITDEHRRPQPDLSMPFFFGGTPSRVDGKPLQIKAISFPFLCVSDGHHLFSIDTRAQNVITLHRSYVKLLKGRRQHSEDRDYAKWWTGEEKENDDAPEPRCCPMCGERLVERLIDSGTPEATWILACRSCGFQGTIPRDRETP